MAIFAGFSHSSMRVAALVSAACFCLTAWPAAVQPLKLERTVLLSGVQGRLDHIDIDVEGKRLFIAALSAGSVEVVDLATGQRVAAIQDLSEPQGVVYLGHARRLLVANGGSGTVLGFDDGRAPAVLRATGLEDADNVRLDAAAGHVYVGYGHALAVLDARTLQLVRRIELGGHPEAFELERHGPRIYVNVPSAGQIAVIDRATAKVTTTWDIAGGSGNFPMALDEAGHRLIVATRQPALLLVFDTSTGRRSAELPLCADADDLFFDSQRGQVYAVCGEGVVDVVRPRGPGQWEVVQRLPTVRGARTGLFVPKLATVFVAVPASFRSSAELRAYRIE
jgi:DNA-binding beta-propeller fold protein YncE